MLDRMSLSMKNGWLDSDNGIGLIEKKRRGLGKPDIIYVKNFASVPDEKEEKEPSNPDVSTEVKDFNFTKQRNLTSGSKKSELQEVNDFASNYNNTNYNNQSHNDINYTNPINQSGSEDNPDRC